MQIFQFNSRKLSLDWEDNMSEESKGMKVLYAVFLLAITARTVIALYDRFNRKDDQDNLKQ
jgi:hypothetical protein